MGVLQGRGAELPPPGILNLPAPIFFSRPDSVSFGPGETLTSTGMSGLFNPRTSRTEENKGACSVRFGMRRLTQSRICIFYLHLCYARKPSTITAFPLGSQQHKMASNPFLQSRNG